MVVSDNIKQMIDILIDKNNHANFGVIRRKAGIWQGVDSFKDMDMLIVRDVNFEMDITSNINELIEVCKPDTVWAEAHFQERIGGKPLNPGESYKIWPYANFDKNTEFQSDKKFDHSYMERFWPKLAGNVIGVTFDSENPNSGIKKYFQTDIPKDNTHPINRGIYFEYGDYGNVCQQLVDNPLNRQAYLPIFFPEDTGAINNIRVPCTLGYLFEIFDNKLDVTYYIRSCDAYRHLRNDIYMAGRLLQHTKNLLFINGMEELETGKLSMKIANLHIFENDLYSINKKERKL